MRRSRERYGTLKSEIESNLFPVQAKPTVADSPVRKVSKIDFPKPEKQKPMVKAEKQTPETNSEVGGGQHRYLQSIIKRVGENNGFVATIEKPVFGGIGKVDVALENEHYKIACEIAVTNTVDYELQNIQKCLASGFDKVTVISSDTRHLGNIRKAAETIITGGQLSKVYFLEPENFNLFLDNLRIEFDTSKNDRSKVKGYKVNAQFKQTSEAETDARKQSVFDTISNFIKRKGKK